MNLLERTDRDGNGKVKVATVQLANSEDNPIDAIIIGELLKIKIKLKLLSPLDLSKFMIAINFLNVNENYVLSYISDEMNINFSNFEFSNEICLTIPKLNLRASSYSIRILLAEGNDRVDRIENVAKIEVLNKDIWNSGSLSREGNEPFINANFSIC